MACRYAAAPPTDFRFVGEESGAVKTKQHEPYPVVAIPDMLDTREQRGTRTKFWAQIEADTERWLLKIPRPGVGEHWAEKITAEVGGLIGVECAQVELARYAEHAVFGPGEGRSLEDRPGRGMERTGLATICKSFLPREYVEETTYFFFHGWEEMQFVVEGHDTSLRFGQRNHSIKNISIATAEPVAVQNRNSMPRWDDALEQRVSYALLGGLVDRHHENWMIVYVVDFGNAFIEVLPSFDHASSLGRELTDEKRRRVLESDGVRRCLERSRGAVCVDNRRRRAPSPLRLARMLRRWMPGLAARTLDRIRDPCERDIRTAVERVPPGFKSAVAKEFACQVVMIGRQELLRSAR